MLENKDIVKVEIKNQLFGKKGIGTIVSADVLRFNGGLAQVGQKKSYLINPITKFKNIDTFSYDINDKNIEIKMPLRENPFIVLLNGTLLYDMQSNFFTTVYPDSEPKQASFLDKYKKFQNGKTNAIYILPLNAGDEFLRDLFAYADVHKQKMFAKRLAVFAEGNALRITRTR